MSGKRFVRLLARLAGALTGLQFVVMALISEMPMRDGEQETGEAFATPTIVHFTAVLMLAASMAMPWHELLPARIGWMLGGLAGLVYAGVILRRMLRQAAYEPVLEDWTFHLLLPSVAYGGLVACATCGGTHTRGALFGIAGVELLLLFVGIHNAWDNVIFLVLLKRQRLQEKKTQSA